MCSGSSEESETAMYIMQMVTGIIAMGSKNLYSPCQKPKKEKFQGQSGHILSDVTYNDS